MSAPPLIDYGRMLELLGIEGRILMSATNEVARDAQVGGVSGLTVERTLCRVSECFADAAERITEPLRAPGARPARSAAEGRVRCAPERTRVAEGAPADLASRLADLLAEFGTRHAHQPCATWQPGVDNVEFWLRRVLHTTAVHRVDVQTASGAPPAAIEPDLARDGVDEILQLWFRDRLNAMGATASTVWSVRIDVDDHSWIAGSGGSSMRVERLNTPVCDGPASTADAVVKGDAASTYLWLWGRLPDRAVRVGGDFDAVAQLWSLLRLATR